jgi:hypothetical protein
MTSGRPKKLEPWGQAAGILIGYLPEGGSIQPFGATDE